MYVKYLFKKDCYDTNKFLHFKLLLKKRGFDDLDIYTKTNSIDAKEEASIVKEWKEHNFDPKAPHIQKINNIFNFDDEQIIKYKEFFIDPTKLLHYLNITKFFFQDFDETNTSVFANFTSIGLWCEKEFNTKKMEQDRTKMKFLKDFCEEVGFDNAKGSFECERELSKQRCEKIEARYKCLFRNKSKNMIIDGSKKKSIQFISKMMDMIFGKKFIEKRRVRDGGEKYTIHNLGEEYDMAKEVYEVNNKDWESDIKEKITIYHKEQEEEKAKEMKKTTKETPPKLEPEPEPEIPPPIIEPPPEPQPKVKLEPPAKWDGYDPTYSMDGGIPKTWRQRKFDEYYTYNNDRELWEKRKAIGYWDEKKTIGNLTEIDKHYIELEHRANKLYNDGKLRGRLGEFKSNEDGSVFRAYREDGEYYQWRNESKYQKCLAIENKSDAQMWFVKKCCFVL